MTVHQCDLLIRGGTVIDGSGAPRRAADVAISEDRISAVGKLEDWRGSAQIDATGLIVAPGFVDAHTHDDRAVLATPEMTPKISQGVTTVVGGNCGVSLAPFTGEPPPPLNLLGGGEWFRFPTMGQYTEAVNAAPPAVNLVMLVGHSALRACTMDRLDRAATADEIKAMRSLADEALAAGAVGLSTGLAYPPAQAAPTEEVIELAKSVHQSGGLYATHMRDEGEGVVGSVKETIHIGQAAQVPVLISHHKCSGKSAWGLTRKTLPLIESARERQEVNLDVYPYTASSTVLIASWVPKAERVMVTWSDPHPECTGQDLHVIAAQWQCSVEEAVGKLSPAGAIYHQMDEADLQRVLRFSDAMIGSDGLPHDQHPHPRLWGTFPRVLGHYCRELELFTLEEALRRMTALPARIFGLTDQGEVRAGAFANVTIFDAQRVKDRASFDIPKQAAIGIEHVIVNGQPVWRDGEWTGNRPGRLLRRA